MVTKGRRADGGWAEDVQKAGGGEWDCPDAIRSGEAMQAANRKLLLRMRL